MKILAIETSCDETALALIQVDKENQSYKVLDHTLYSQIKEHSKYGGVVPFLASRLHSKKLPQMLVDFIHQNGRDIDKISVTTGPGLSPSLYVGANQALLLGTAMNIPVESINHLHGHIWSSFMNYNLEGEKPANDIFPFISILISGGHTEMILVQKYNSYKVISKTVDDAVGEAFDKVAKMLNLGYPGGPIVSKLAMKGDPQIIKFPRPMISSGDGKMSFSGLKTAVLYYLRDHHNMSKQDINNLCASFEQAVIDVIISKTSWVIEKYNPKLITVGGGVIANQELRDSFIKLSSKYNLVFKLPISILTTDNAIMIGIVGALNEIYNIKEKFKNVDPNWELPEID